MSDAAKVSVIVPHYNDLDGLDRCLDKLSRQTFPREDFEIVVADNASPIGEAAVAARIAGRAKLVTVTQKGAGPARNGGVAASHGQILAFIDSDCQPDPDWLAEGVAALSTYDFVGGQVRVLVDNPHTLTPAEAFERVFAFDNASYVAKKGFTVTANLFCPRALFDAVGGFRTKVSEDVDWSHRARAAGYRLGYAAAAIVGHPARRTWADLNTKWRRLNAESFALMTSRKGGRAKWLARSLILPASAVVHVPKIMTSPELDDLGQRISAIGVLFRSRMWRFFDAWRLLRRKDEV
jgi:glycosyltransferase involved in cell wall biosynthesis